ncbi:transporter family protein [Ferruginibacter sp.]|nr:hypothetical protein [Ferruginibacter sp.]
MKKLFIIIAVLAIVQHNVNAQGCVAIKSNGGYCAITGHHADSSKNKIYTLSINHRYYRSYKHFVGTAEQKQRTAAGTEVVNYAHTTDFNLTKTLKEGWSVSIDVPIIANNRSSLYEHGGKSRHSTNSFGLGDIRLAAYKWIVDPVRMTKANIQAGLGLKLPTGDYKYTDKFFVNDSTTILGPVDQSIQLGDGGLGFTTELNAYYNISKNFTAYGNFYYLINPREQNGTSTKRGGLPTATDLRYGSDVMSVPDQYMFRAGINYSYKKLTVAAGIREECLPAKDLVGGSNGFRRPGYIISVEPGVTYEFKKFSAYAYVPVALKRSRTQSVPDKIRTSITGVYAQGDAAFADYAINVGLTFKF